MTLKELGSKIKPLLNKGLSIQDEYKIGEEYNFEVIGDVIIITLQGYNVSNGKKIQLQEYILDRVFKNLIKETGGELINKAVVGELGYVDSLEWLYNHYKYGKSNGSNCILCNSSGQILAIQYNGQINTDTIYSVGIPIEKSEVVINNSIILNSKIYKKQLNDLLDVCQYLYNNNKIKVGN